MTSPCIVGHAWLQVQHDSITDCRCRVCGALGRPEGNPITVNVIMCSHGDAPATRKLAAPSNTYMCEKHYIAHIEKQQPSYRRGGF